jgi:hypothetical protein
VGELRLRFRIAKFRGVDRSNLLLEFGNEDRDNVPQKFKVEGREALAWMASGLELNHHVNAGTGMPVTARRRAEDG